MKFSDILDLARQGYKPSDIRELLSMDTEPETKPEPKPEPEPEPKPDQKSEPDPEPKPDPKSEPEPDYKKMYEDTLKRLDALQKSNQRQPIDDKKDDVNDIIRDVFY